eukprot:c5280_g1_i1 orf=641-892(+)
MRHCKVFVQVLLDKVEGMDWHRQALNIEHYIQSLASTSAILSYIYIHRVRRSSLYNMDVFASTRLSPCPSNLMTDRYNVRVGC